MKTFLIVGLGSFGAAAAEKLFELGHEVLIIDQNEEAVSHLADKATHAAIGDAREPEVLKAIGAGECDCAIVALGENLAASIIITMNLKDLGIGTIICKAQDEMCKRALERVGADRVVIPEKELAVRLAESLGSNSFLDYIALSSDYAMVEVAAPKAWCGKSLKELMVRAEYGVSVLAIKHEGSVTMSPGAEDMILKGDTVMLMGTYEDIHRLKKL